MSSEDEEFGFGGHPGMAMDSELIEEEDLQENKRLAGEELREIRQDAKNLVRSIEREHDRDLSRHLYAIYLNRKKRAKEGLRYFPHARYTQWPVSALRGEIHDSVIPEDLDLSRDIHKVIPPFAEMYTRVDEPREDIYYGQCAPGDPVHDRTYDDFDEAKGVLMAESSAIFEGLIKRRILSEKRFVPPPSETGDEEQNEKEVTDGSAGPEGYCRLEPIIDIDAPMPMQSRMRVMKLVNRILDNISQKEIDPVRAVIRTCNWKDIIHNDIRVGETFARCKELFLSDLPNDNSVQVSLNDARILNHMGHLETPLPGNHKSKKELLATAALKPTAPVIGTDELLENMLIRNVPDCHEFSYVTRRLAKASKRVDRRRRAMAALVKKQRLELIDKRLYSQTRKRGYWTMPVEIQDDDDFYV